MFVKSKNISLNSISYLFKNHTKPFLLENKKIIIKFIFTLFFISIGIWFLMDQRSELIQVQKVIETASVRWVITGLALTVIYILLQGLMYVLSFASIGKKVSLFDATILFIKRNLISIFLPAGGVSSLAFFTGDIEKKGIKNSQIHFASSIYGFIGILSVIIVALPAFIFAVVNGSVGSKEWFALALIILLTVGVYYISRSMLTNGYFYRILVKFFPASEVFITDLQNNKIDRHYFLFTILVSVFIEFIGIAHLYIAMVALNIAPSVLAAIMGYIVSVIFLIISPFLRGLGAIEVSMAYILIRFGFGNVEAIAVTFLYRFFEFWTPLLVGLAAFVSKVNKFLMRIFPAFLLLIIGIVNIISALTPAISERVSVLKKFLPIETISASNYLVLTAGLLLLATAAFLLKGLKNAWYFAIFLCVVSIIGNITKAIDFEEAMLALLELIILIGTRKQYYIKTNHRLHIVGIQTALIFACVTIIYGMVGFYFLDKKHFNDDFSLLQSLQYTIENYLLIGSNELTPQSSFAHKFLISINLSGFTSMAFLVYTFLRTHVPKKNIAPDELTLAKELIKNHGNSALDYFKTSDDKLIFFSKNKRAFISYRISGNFAVVLGDPIAENLEEMKICISEFDMYCFQNGLKNIFYRVPEKSLEIYSQLRKKYLFLGQEGVVNLLTFNLSGRARRPIRNAMYKVVDRGFTASIHEPPVSDGVLQKIKAVSDEWLDNMDRSEIIFSQGMFNWDELKNQTIITVENSEEKIIAFLNIIPDFNKDEGTFDLIRKTTDAPNGVMDFIHIELFNYLKLKNIKYANIGFAPMAGLINPNKFWEKSMKFAYEKIKSFSHYKGLRGYKQKFDPEWFNQYLIYQNDYDLLQIPKVLSKVIKP